MPWRRANIVVVNRLPSIQGLLNAVSTAANYPGVSVVSTSTGATQFSGEVADESYFANPTNHGGINVSFVTASGDDKSAASPGPLFPSVLPNVLSVGGTVLTLSPIGGSEQSWTTARGAPVHTSRSRVIRSSPSRPDSARRPTSRSPPRIIPSTTRFLI